MISFFFWRHSDNLGDELQQHKELCEKGLEYQNKSVCWDGFLNQGCVKNSCSIKKDEFRWSRLASDHQICTDWQLVHADS